MEGNTYLQPRCSVFALAFAASLPKLKEVANAHGYCMAVHGSMHRDLDLVLCPWADEAASALKVAEAMRKAIGGFAPGGRKTDTPSKRPHGRLAFAYYPTLETARDQNGPYIDISVMPRRRKRKV